MRHRLLLAAALSMTLVAPAFAQGPLTTAFTYQGELRQSGAPATGLYDLRFRLFDALTAGGQLGSTLCADNVTLSAGRFTVDLDFGPQFAGQQRFLEIEVRQDTGADCANTGGFTLLAPRQPLTAAPYAAYALGTATAANATSLNGQSGSFYQNAANLTTGTIPSPRLAGAYSSALSLTNSSNVFTGSFSGSGSALTMLNASSLSSGTLDPARLPVPLAITGADPAQTLRAENTSSSPAASGLFGIASAASGATSGVRGESASPTGFGLYGMATAATGANRGVYGGTLSPNGAGVMGESTNGAAAAIYALTHSAAGYGVFAISDATGAGARAIYGQVNSSSGIGIFGRNNAFTGSAYGVLGQTASTDGSGVFGSYGISGIGSGTGVRGESNGDTGRGVYGRANSLTGASYGVFGEAASNAGYAVYGRATGTSGANYGGYFTVASPGGSALYCENTAGGEAARIIGTTTLTGNASVTGAVSVTTSVVGGTSVFANGSSAQTTGVYGRGTSYGVFGAGLGLYGVYGSANTGSYGVYASGNLGSNGVKSFRIDHPADPENKYLLHYCTESPEVLNAYSGKITLDERGEATIALPAYFAGINRDPRYTLTPIGAPMPALHVAQEIDDMALAAGNAIEPGQPIPPCSFRIAGGAPGSKVSWRVEAVRNDRYVQHAGAPVEADKPAEERGTYQLPELYAQPPERGATFNRSINQQINADLQSTTRP